MFIVIRHLCALPGWGGGTSSSETIRAKRIFDSAFTFEIFRLRDKSTNNVFLFAIIFFVEKTTIPRCSLSAVRRTRRGPGSATRHLRRRVQEDNSACRRVTEERRYRGSAAVLPDARHRPDRQSHESPSAVNERIDLPESSDRSTPLIPNIIKIEKRKDNNFNEF